MPVRTTRTCLRAFAATLLLAAPLGCATRAGVVTRPPTLGEELLALAAARRDGLLDDREFDLRRDETIRVWKAIGTAPAEVDGGESAVEEEPMP